MTSPFKTSKATKSGTFITWILGRTALSSHTIKSMMGMVHTIVQVNFLEIMNLDKHHLVAQQQAHFMIGYYTQVWQIHSTKQLLSIILASLLRYHKTHLNIIVSEYQEIIFLTFITKIQVLFGKYQPI